jgi:hypothetical protein
MKVNKEVLKKPCMVEIHDFEQSVVARYKKDILNNNISS